MKTEKAKVQMVPVGHLEIEGLMLPDGSFGVGVPQVATLFSFPQNYASQTLKRLLGERFRPHKTATEIGNEKINVLPLSDFDFVLLKLAIQGNKKAQEMALDLVGLSLHQLFCDAFSIEIDAEYRQKWLLNRQKTKIDFRPLTEQLKAHGMKEDYEFGLFIHSMQEKIGLTDGTRDLVDLVKLQELADIQVSLTSYMECGLHPYDALAKYSKKLKT